MQGLGLMHGTGSGADKPTGDYVDGMVADGAWPQTRESELEHHRTRLDQTRSKLSAAADGWAHGKAAIFNGPTVWVGPGADSANTQVGNHSTAVNMHKQQLDDAIDWIDEALHHLSDVKETINGNVQNGLDRILNILQDAAKDGTDPTQAVEDEVKATYNANKGALEAKAVSLGWVKESPPIPGDIDRSDDQQDKEPPSNQKQEANSETKNPNDGIQTFTSRGDDSVETSTLGFTNDGRNANALIGLSRGDDAVDTSVLGSTDEGPVANAQNSQPRSDDANVTATTGTVNSPGSTGGRTSSQSPTSGQQPPPIKGAPPIDVGSSGPPTQGPSGLGGVGGVTGGGGGASGGAGGGPSAPSGLGSSPTDAAGKPDNGFGKMDPTKMAGPTQPPGGPSTGMQPPANPLNQMAHGLANAGPAMQPSAAPIAPPTPTPDVGAGAPGATGAPGASSGGASGGSWSGGSAPVSSTPSGGGSSMGGGMPPAMPLGPPPTPSPSAPSAPSGGSSGGSGSGSSQPGSASVHPASANSSTNSAAAAAAAAAGVAPMPVSAARLERDAVIAATSGGSSRGKSNDALTVARRIAAALNAIQVVDFGFFWMTAVAADDTIVVANSYGIGYIPEGVNLPAQVKFANIDESIPPADRGKWTSYPLLMLQGWAQHHNNPLKQVIATEEQFKGSDPGVAKIVLQPDDIPANGIMQGRSRLEVVAPHAAERLSSTSDFNLTELLPPAPADPQPQAEEDQFMKWFSVMQCLMSDMEGRVQAHLKAFVSYADYAQEQALYAAHSATDAAAQRAAIADWVYWQHLSVLMSDALQAGVTV